MKKKDANIIKMIHAETTPVDLAISRCMQNLYATYGEDKVKVSLNELFGMKSKSKKVA